MKAGRELDALVAETVMGWSFHDTGEYEEMGGKQGYTRIGISVDVKPYSTDIAAAWEVVEELKRRDFVLNVNAPWDDPANARPGGIRYWCVMIAPAFGLGISYQRLGANADTAPHAICLAALKAVGYFDAKD